MSTKKMSLVKGNEGVRNPSSVKKEIPKPPSSLRRTSSKETMRFSRRNSGRTLSTSTDENSIEEGGLWSPSPHSPKSGSFLRHRSSTKVLDAKSLIKIEERRLSKEREVLLDTMTQHQDEDSNEDSALLPGRSFKRAASRTVHIMRTRQGMSDADKIMVPFNETTLPLPKIVKVNTLKNAVFHSMGLHCGRERSMLNYYFVQSGNDKKTALDDILNDLFWYTTVAWFQDGAKTNVAIQLQKRIAHNYTTFFMSLPSPSAVKNTTFLNLLPDALAQFTYHALHDAYKSSRKRINSNLKMWLLKTTYAWLVGIQPKSVTGKHWIVLDALTSTIRTADVGKTTEFPAMRNKALCAERLEKIARYETKKYQEILLLGKDKHGTDKDRGPPQSELVLSKNLRHLYSMNHSPVVSSFLTNHKIPVEPARRTVRIRLTNDATGHLDHQEALHKNEKGPVHRRTRLLDAKSYRELSTQFEKFSNRVQNRHKTARKGHKETNLQEMLKLQIAEKHLQGRLDDVTSAANGIHEMSNILVCQRNFQASTTQARRPLI